ncbi:MAG TPA: hypothetical protein VK614_11045 [Allosphingosinicella sp.]|nr:hypothetical protein [Allosphingosinicella sp.]
MERNGNITPPESPPAAAPPAANDVHPGGAEAEPAPNLPALNRAGEVEDAAYWRGYHAALAVAAQPAADDSDSPRVRRMRIDGFSGEKQAVFLESIAAGFTVGEAAGRARISVTAVYNFRNRRAGHAFNIAWEAADRRARRPLADHLRGRAVEGQTDTLRDKEGGIVGTRHRHDNRLAMAILTRLDRKAEAYREDERLVTVIAEEFEEMLDVIAAEGDAEEFIAARRPAEQDYPPPGRAPVARMLTEHEQLRRRYQGADPADIDISDLIMADRHSWTADQRYRADKAGFFERYWAAREAGSEEQEYEPLPPAVRHQLGV